MNKIFKCLIRFLIEVIVMTVLIVGINIFMNGNRGNFLSGRFTNKVNQFKFVSFTSGQLAPNFYN